MMSALSNNIRFLCSQTCF